MLIAIICAIGSFSSCVKQTPTSDFNPAPYRDSPSAVTLCFDLRNDDHPIAGLVLKVNQVANLESHAVALPFESAHVSMNREIYSTWGSYEDMTLINYHTSPSTSGTYSIGIVPIVGLAPPEQWSEDPYELEGASVYFIKTSSLVRHFIFRYPDADPKRRQWLQDIAGLANTNVESVGIVLPPNIEGRAIRRTNRTSVPDPVLEAGITKFYPTSKQAAQVDAIHIKYELPPNKNQQLIIEQTIKLVIALIPPILQFLVIRLRRPEQKKRAKRLIWIIASVQVILLVGLLYMAYSSWQESTGKALGDLTAAIISGLFTAYNLWDEKKDSSTS
ncbi:MAG TPA: hypothetical protein VGW12_07790 [Pyrinomonadaceae bacterium]|nr:hypothetical protein [Pyrinomonadaceae bacterium]